MITVILTEEIPVVKFALQLNKILRVFNIENSYYITPLPTENNPIVVCDNFYKWRFVNNKDIELLIPDSVEVINQHFIKNQVDKYFIGNTFNYPTNKIKPVTLYWEV